MAKLILLFIGFGISHIQIENWTPFIPENTGKWGGLFCFRQQPVRIVDRRTNQTLNQ